MNVISLIENTTHDRNLYAEHGLSLYLETRQHKVLFDTGASGRFQFVKFHACTSLH